MSVNFRLRAPSHFGEMVSASLVLLVEIGHRSIVQMFELHGSAAK